ncbi:sulfite exporter TauE/SafE family protein [Vogesella sp. LIG4]|uniref:sulfite exporter TauE/SafE family protein n=1 Tax=Vogesella sp. LIG4 TaxID=1192162 RepID=UPI00082015B0|nr:sulfite exporter TauE/SafE family protein [Vogesella sp. LIG4]SCK12575.1 hypothetical protein PSELUDRAFT_1136 [Vogesella sp. LIG4]
MHLGAVTTLAALLLGAVLGGVGGLLGIGGGILAIPLLGAAYGLDQTMAQGTALVMMVPNVLLAFWRYRQRSPFPLSLALRIGALSVLATWLAAHLALGLDKTLLRQIFAGFLLLLGGYFWRESRPRPQRATQQPWPARYLPGVGLVGGACAGFFSVGAGIVAAPILVRGFGKAQAEAQGLALALVLPGALVALASYGRAGAVDWPLGLCLALGGLFTVSPGVALAYRLPQPRLRQLFALMLWLTAGLSCWLG